jgi:hypothetical protein
MGMGKGQGKASRLQCLWTRVGTGQVKDDKEDKNRNTCRYSKGTTSRGGETRRTPYTDKKGNKINLN